MIWLIGNKGMLGQQVADQLNVSRLAFIGSGSECDVTNFNTLKNFTKNKNITWIINCSAYTAVDKAEDEQQIAEKINALGPQNIGLVSTEIGAQVIHVSTDYVFDGTKDAPYIETDVVEPIGTYGRTKAEGEILLAASCNQHYIIRTSWLYGKYGNNFAATMIRLFSERDEVKVVSDQWGSPTYAGDLAKVIIEIIKQDNKNFGIYHFSNEGRTNWFEFASEIYKRGRALGLLTKETNVVPIKTSEYPTKTKRPEFSYLSKDKIKKIFGVHVPLWQESLGKYLAEIKL